MADYTPTPHLDYSGKYVAAPNHLARLSEPVLRVPIGGSAGANVPLGTKRARFRLRVPSLFGGTLTLHGTSVKSIVLKRRAGESMKEVASSISKIVHDVEKDAHGIYIAEVTLYDLSTSVKLACTFVQTGTARDGTSKSAPPIIPWHFFYWPAADASPNTPNPWTERSGQILDKLARSLGASGPLPSVWEHKNHRVPYGKGSWEGHCHHAAPASALFKQPAAHPTDPDKQAPVSIGGETFTQDELELIATEWFANYGQEDRVFGLRGEGFGKHPAVVYLKPGEKPTQAALEKGAAAFGLRQSDAAGFITERGGQERFEAWVIEEFGKAAVRFFDPLLDHLYFQQKPVNVDMRAGRGSGQANEIWNQVFFHMVAEYRELDHDDLKMRVTAVLFSNNDITPADAQNPETLGLPAEVIPGTNEVRPNATALKYTNVWYLELDEAGALDGGTGYCRWVSVKNKWNEEVYAPRVGRTPKAPKRTRNDELTKLKVGNPGVPFDLVSRGYLEMWSRYKP